MLIGSGIPTESRGNALLIANLCAKLVEAIGHTTNFAPILQPNIGELVHLSPYWLTFCTKVVLNGS